MDAFKEFLESSTIHGLVYVSTSRKFVRFLWTVVVVAGFISAGYLISQSFANWADQPIKTTIETLPISKITLPTVTVCPPKDTYTSLNYDLMRMDNVTLDNDTRKELLDYFYWDLHNPYFKDVLKSSSKFKEKNRYQNWYLGITQLELPYKMQYVDFGKCSIKDF